jgi:flavin-binding protein dodecin
MVLPAPAGGARHSPAVDNNGLRRRTMAKKNDDGIYKIVEVVGTSKKSWEDAASNAVAAAAKTLRDLRIAEITKLDMKVEDGNVVAYRARVSLSFKYER